MVAGHLREKSGYYYAVLNYTDSLGKRKTKWISTGLTVKGNKKRAEAILMDARRNFNPEEPKVMNGDILFADYMEKWLDIIKSSVAVPTFASYSTTVKKIVAPYFREKEVTLKNLTAKDIQEFYLSELERVSPSSVIHYHANIHKALKYAVKIDLIDVNPADKVERPKKDRYVGSFYDADEVNALFEAAKGSKLELPILFGAFYGLRRSEAIGLKWDAIDFDQNTITIRHTVTSCDLDGKRVLVASDTTKTKSSMRTLPLVPFMRERLLTLKEEQQENRRLCGRSYIKEYLEYVCVNEIGDLIKPHYVTESFPKLLKAKGMRQIRYHDLRHSCASLLLANGVPMKQIQEWLGHSDFSTTANIYAHLDYSSLHRTEKEKPAAGKTDYWRDFWRSGWDSNPRNLAVQLISSQSRYDHFDTAPYLSQHQHLGKRGELMGRTSKNIKLRIPEKTHKIKGFRSGSYRVATTISSLVRTWHFRVCCGR